MKAYVISLAASLERRQFQRTQLSAFGLAFEMVDAVTACELDTMATQLSVDDWQRPLMPTEIACFHSHLKIWLKISQADAPALILEDDVLLSQKIVGFLDVTKRLQGIDHISLEARLRKKLLGPVRTLNKEMGIARLYQDRTGAAAYILWPKGARRLIQHAHQHGAALADALISNLYALNSWQALPALAIQSDVAINYGINSQLKTHSYIQAENTKANHKAQGQKAIRFKIRRVSAQLKQALHYLAHCSHAHRQNIPIDFHGFHNPLTHEKET